MNQHSSCHACICVWNTCILDILALIMSIEKREMFHHQPRIKIWTNNFHIKFKKNRLGNRYIPITIAYTLNIGSCVTMTTTCNSCSNPLNQWCKNTITFLALGSGCSSKPDFFETLHTILYMWHNLHDKISYVHMEHTVIQNAKHTFNAVHSDSSHGQTHVLHICSICNLSFSKKGHRWALLFCSNRCQHRRERQWSESKRRRTRRRKTEGSRTVISDEIRGTVG